MTIAETGEPLQSAETVFLSYSHEDRRRALPIIHILEQAGFAVWWDGLLEGGERFSRRTEAALEGAKAVVVLWSKASTVSHWVHDEATRGRDRRCLVPISLDGSEAPLGFRQFQVLDAKPAKVKVGSVEMQALLHAVAVLHDRDTEDFARIAKPPSIDRRTAIVGGGVAALIGTGLVAWQTGLLGGKGGIANRIAVLPLANLSGDPKQNYLSDGLTAEIRSMLAQNGALQVVGQASSEAFEEKKLDATDIAKKLRAAFLIDGTMRIANDMIRITIEMIDGKTGINRSPKIFEKSMDDLFLLQREIAGAVSAELSSRIALSDPTKIPIGGTANAVAFDHYLRGRELYLHGRDEAEERAAVTQFDAAIATDPKFAAAHAGRSRSLTAVASQFGSAREIKIHHEAAVQSAHRAVELAPLFADAQSTLAFTLFQGGLDIRGAKKPFELSRKLGEGEAPVMARFAIYCASTGRNREAASAIDGALILDPLNALVQRVAGTVHYAARRFDAAISATREALSLNPNLGDTHARIGMVQIAQKKYAEALKSFDKESHKWSKLAGIAIAQHHLGNSVAAKTAMAGLTSDTEVVSLYQQGQVLAQWGQLEAAVTMLLRAYEQRDAGMTALFFDPMLDPVRTQPRFIGLLKTMGYA